MACYFDSSYLLAVLFGQGPVDDLATLWDQEDIRVASQLTVAECLVSVRRVALSSGRLGARRLRVWSEAIDLYLGTLYRKPVDDDVVAILRLERRLAPCRTLDALHLATAMYFQRQVDQPLAICSLDRRMRAVASSLGFMVKPGL